MGRCDMGRPSGNDGDLLGQLGLGDMLGARVGIELGNVRDMVDAWEGMGIEWGLVWSRAAYLS